MVSHLIYGTISWMFFSGKKGGALSSSVYSYMLHGDPFIASLIKHILTMVSVKFLLSFDVGIYS